MSSVQAKRLKLFVGSVDGGESNVSISADSVPAAQRLCDDMCSVLLAESLKILRRAPGANNGLEKQEQQRGAGKSVAHQKKMGPHHLHAAMENLHRDGFMVSAPSSGTLGLLGRGCSDRSTASQHSLEFTEVSAAPTMLSGDEDHSGQCVRAMGQRHGGNLVHCRLVRKRRLSGDCQ